MHSINVGVLVAALDEEAVDARRVEVERRALLPLRDERVMLVATTKRMQRGETEASRARGIVVDRDPLVRRVDGLAAQRARAHVARHAHWLAVAVSVHLGTGA